MIPNPLEICGTIELTMIKSIENLGEYVCMSNKTVLHGFVGFGW